MQIDLLQCSWYKRAIKQWFLANEVKNIQETKKNPYTNVVL